MRPFLKYFVTFAALIGNQRDFTRKKERFRRLAKELACTAFSIAGCLLFLHQPAAEGKVIRLDEVDLAGKRYTYLYQWSDPEIKPTAIIIAIHGLTLHGLVYDKLAYHLAQEGILVLAPDLPGYGRRWHKEAISYSKAQQNILEIVESVKSVYKDLPVVCLGESLGANVALAVAQNSPSLIDGIILSSPALKTRLKLTPKSMVSSVNMVVGLIKSDAEVDLCPFMKAYASEDPTIIETMVHDPLIHSQMKCQELWESYQGMRPVFKQAKLISKTMPVLILQGKKDKILKADAIIKLVSSLNSENQTVKWFKSRGHMILEECEPKADALQTIDDWLKSQIDRQVLEVKVIPVMPVTSSLPTLTNAVLNSNTTPE